MRLPFAGILLAAPIAAPFAAAFVGLAGCGTPPPPPPPPATAKLELAGTAIVDTEVTGTITVGGCEGPASVALKDGERTLSTFQADGETPFAIGHEETAGRGFTVELVLRAEATCSDGRTASSREIGVSFFPVARAFRLPGDEQVVTDTFVIEGEGTAVSFLGCALNANGTTSLVRVDASGEILAQRELPFRCSKLMRFTEKDPDTGVRWLYEPGVGELAFTPSLLPLSTRRHTAMQLTILPGGDALSYAPTASPSLARFPASADNPSWTIEGVNGVVSPIRFLPPNQARIVIWYATQGYSALAVQEFDVGLVPNPDRFLGQVEVFRYPTGAPLPVSVLDEDASTLFVAEPTGMGITNVYACATNLAGCSGDALQWQAVPVQGEAKKILTYADGARVLVVTDKGTFTFDAQSGYALNFGTAPILPFGTFVTHEVIATDSGAYFLLNGPAPTETNLHPAPLELVGVDDPGRGETFRMQIATSGLAAGVDEAGALWVRVGAGLVRTHPLSTYRSARSP